MRGWQFHQDLRDYLRTEQIRIPKENIEYQGADYNTVMYFFDNNFKGEFEEKKKMYYLLSRWILNISSETTKRQANGTYPCKWFS